MSADLHDTIARALDTVVADLAARSDLVALLYFGSAARGEATIASDIDLYATTAGDGSKNAGRVVADVPIEISFSSLARVVRARPGRASDRRERVRNGASAVRSFRRRGHGAL